MLPSMQPYVDEPDNCGMQMTERENLFNMTMESDKSKLQVIFSPSLLLFMIHLNKHDCNMMIQ